MTDRDRMDASASEWFLPAVSILVLACYSLLVLVHPRVEPLRAILIAIIFGSWVALILSFLIRLIRTPRGERRGFIRLHRQDLAAAVFPLLGVFSPLRRLKTVPGLRGNGGNAFRSRLGIRAALYAITFVYLLALTELLVERDQPGATILTFGNSIWWACVTIATVGYGDFAPVSPLGRIVAIALMVGGVVIIGTTSALIVSYLSERIHRAGSPADGTDRSGPR